MKLCVCVCLCVSLRACEFERAVLIPYSQIYVYPALCDIFQLSHADLPLQLPLTRLPIPIQFIVGHLQSLLSKYRAVGQVQWINLATNYAQPSKIKSIKLSTIKRIVTGVLSVFENKHKCLAYCCFIAPLKYF